MESRLRRLSHEVPSWVKEGAVYHIRIRTELERGKNLTGTQVGTAILESTAFYQEQQNWNCRLMLLMPDHLHALMSFNPEKGMSESIRNWKRFHANNSGVVWLEGFFDHRIRSDESLEEKALYIRKNPVVKGLCEKPEDWQWVWDEGVWI